MFESEFWKKHGKKAAVSVLFVIVLVIVLVLLYLAYGKEYMIPLYNPAKEKRLMNELGTSKVENMMPELYVPQVTQLMQSINKEHMIPLYNPAKEKRLMNELGTEHMIPLYNPTKEKQMINRLGKEKLVNDMLYVERVYNTLANPTKEHLENGIPLYRPKDDIAKLRALS